MRWAVAVALLALAAALLAGCSGRPATAGAEPDRPSVAVPPQEIGGHLIGTGGSMRVSLVPSQASAAVSPDEPVNCVAVDDADDERTSFIGGLLLDLAWDSVGSATEELNVTIVGPGPPGEVQRWHAQGATPLHVVVDAAAAGERPVRTPLSVSLAPAGPGVLLLDQPVAWTVQVGILESDIGALRWTDCSSPDFPL